MIHPSSRSAVLFRKMRKIAQFASFVMFGALVFAGLSLVGYVRPALADDLSRAVVACRATVAQQVDGIDAASLGLERVGGGGRRYKVWLAASANDDTGARQFYCLVTRRGEVEELTAFGTDGTPARTLLVTR